MQFALLTLATAGLGTRAHAAEWPAYLRTAFAEFTPEPAPGWAFTITTEREGKKITERFDPAKPGPDQWTLLLMSGIAPTAEQSESYFKLKASQAPGPTKATFQTRDIEPGSFTLVTEEADQATYLAEFREAASSSDKMLAHLRVRLRVRKAPAFVERYQLELKEPYSPILGVKMQELTVSMDFSAPTANQPALPQRGASRFAGRILLFPTRENIDYEYAAFTRAP